MEELGLLADKDDQGVLLQVCFGIYVGVCVCVWLDKDDRGVLLQVSLA